MANAPNDPGPSLPQVNSDSILGVHMPNIYISKVILDTVGEDHALKVVDPHIGNVEWNYPYATNMDLDRPYESVTHDQWTYLEKNDEWVLKSLEGKWNISTSSKPKYKEGDYNDVVDETSLKVSIDLMVKDKWSRSAVNLASTSILSNGIDYLRAKTIISLDPEITDILTNQLSDPNHSMYFFGLNGAIETQIISVNDLHPNIWVEILNNIGAGPAFGLDVDVLKIYGALPVQKIKAMKDAKMLAGGYPINNYKKYEDVLKVLLHFKMTSAAYDIDEDDSFEVVKSAIKALQEQPESVQESAFYTKDIAHYAKTIHKEIDSDGNTIYSFPIRRTFKIVNNSKPNHLAIFAYAYLDFKALEEEVSGMVELFGWAAIPDEMINFLGAGKVTSDVVIRNGSVVKSGLILKDAEGNVWNGPVHKNAKGQWMKYSSAFVTLANGTKKNRYYGPPSSGTGPPVFSFTEYRKSILISQRVPYNKVHDFRIFKGLEKFESNFTAAAESLLTSPALDSGQFKTAKKEVGLVVQPGMISLADSSGGTFMGVNIEALTGEPTGDKGYTQRTIELIEKEKIPPYFSTIKLATDKSGKCRFLFEIDYRRLLKDNSIYPNLFNILPNSAISGLIAKSAIIEMKIIRRRILPTSVMTNRLGTVDQPTEQYEKNKFPAIIALSGETSAYNFQKKTYTEQNFTATKEQFLAETVQRTEEGRKEIRATKTRTAWQQISREMGIIREAAFTGGAHFLAKTRTFCGIDYDIADIDAGIYQYGIQLEIKDPTINFLREKLTTLRSLISNEEGTGWQDYRDYVISDPENINIHTNTFTSKLKNYYKSISSSYHPATTLVTFHNFLESFTIGTLQGSLIKLLNISMPESGSGRGVDLVLRLMTNYLRKFEKIVEDVTIKKRLYNLKSDKQNPIMPFSPSKKIENIKVEHWFEDTFNASNDGTFGYDFVSTVSNANSYTDNAGLKVITVEEYSSRFYEEFSSDKFSKGAKFGYFSENPFEVATFLSPSYVYLPQFTGDIGYQKTLNLLDSGPPHPQLEKTQIHTTSNMSEEEIKNLALSILIFNNVGSSQHDVLTNVNVIKGVNFKNPGGYKHASGWSTVNESFVSSKTDLELSLENQEERAKLVHMTGLRGCTITGLKAPEVVEEPEKTKSPLNESFSFSELQGMSVSSANPNSLLYEVVGAADLGTDDYSGFINLFNLEKSEKAQKALEQIGMDTAKVANKLYQIWKEWDDLNSVLFDTLPLPEDIKTAESPLNSFPGQLMSIAVDIDEWQKLADDPNKFSLAQEPNLSPNFKNAAIRELLNKKIVKVQGYWGLNESNTRDEVWKDLTIDDMENLSTTHSSGMLCRVNLYARSLFNIGPRDPLYLPTLDEYFILWPGIFLAAPETTTESEEMVETPPTGDKAPAPSGKKAPAGSAGEGETGPPPPPPPAEPPPATPPPEKKHKDPEKPRKPESKKPVQNALDLARMKCIEEGGTWVGPPKGCDKSAIALANLKKMCKHKGGYWDGAHCIMPEPEVEEGVHETVDEYLDSTETETPAVEYVSTNTVVVVEVADDPPDEPTIDDDTDPAGDQEDDELVDEKEELEAAIKAAEKEQKELWELWLKKAAEEALEIKIYTCTHAGGTWVDGECVMPEPEPKPKPGHVGPSAEQTACENNGGTWIPHFKGSKHYKCFFPPDPTPAPEHGPENGNGNGNGNGTGVDTTSGIGGTGGHGLSGHGDMSGGSGNGNGIDDDFDPDFGDGFGGNGY